MSILKGARIISLLFILCALSFGLYFNFSETGPNAYVNSAVMVFAYK